MWVKSLLDCLKERYAYLTFLNCEVGSVICSNTVLMADGAAVGDDSLAGGSLKHFPALQSLRRV